MVQKNLILALFFYLLMVLQTSFLVHFNIWGIVPNLILISVVFINLFTSHRSWLPVSSAFIGGFFLDVSSSQFIGWHVFILLGLAAFIAVLRRYIAPKGAIKVILRKYVRTPTL